LLDRAVAAINRGDRATATALAGQVLATDSANAEAEDLLAAPSDPGEIRRLTIFFADLVDSTVLSRRVEPETYRLLVGRYHEMVLRAVNRSLITVWWLSARGRLSRVTVRWWAAIESWHTWKSLGCGRKPAR
jgi:class 3 adenylate cyclase